MNNPVNSPLIELCLKAAEKLPYQNSVLLLYMVYLKHLDGNIRFSDSIGQLKFINEAGIVDPEIASEMKRLLKHQSKTTNTYLAKIDSYLNTNQTNLVDLTNELFPLLTSSSWRELVDNTTFASVEYGAFITELCGVSDNAKIYNPSGAYYHVDVDPSRKMQFTVQEPNYKLFVAGKIRLLISKPLLPLHYYHSDSMNEWNPENTLYDAIIVHLPYRHLLFKQDSINMWEDFLFKKCLPTLTSTGKIALVVPSIFQTSIKYSTIRKKLIELNLVESAITFTLEKTVGRQVNYTLMVINNNKQNNTIKIVDALGSNDLPTAIQDSKKGRLPSWDISIESCRKNDYRMIPEDYLFRNIEGVELSEVLKYYNKNSFTNHLTGLVVNASHLSTDRNENYLNTDKLEKKEIKSGKKIDCSCLLVNLVSDRPLAPTYFRYEGTPILSIPVLSAFTLHKTIDPGYLIQELHSQRVKNQLNELGRITNSLFLSHTDFLKIKIQLPDYQTQVEILPHILEIVSEQKKNNRTDYLNRFDDFDKMDQEARVLRHSLAGRLMNVNSSIEAINDLIQLKLRQQFPAIMETKKTDQSKLTLNDHLKIATRDIKSVIGELESYTRNPNVRIKEKPVNINLLEYLNKFAQENSDKNRVEFNFEKEFFTNEEGDLNGLYINCFPSLLRSTLDNLVENAHRHAFDKQLVNNRIELRVSLVLPDSETAQPDTFARIQVMNTGNPWPSDFGFDLFLMHGLRNGKYSGNGIGGWMVGNNVKRMNGSISLDTQEELQHPFVTSISIYIPTSNYVDNE